MKVGTNTLDVSTVDSQLEGEYSEQPSGLGNGSVGLFPLRINGTSSESVLRFSSTDTIFNGNDEYLQETTPDERLFKTYTGVQELVDWNVEFYGSVRYANDGVPITEGPGGNAQPIRILRRPIGASNWTTAAKDVTDCFTTGQNLNENCLFPREIVVKNQTTDTGYSFASGFEYAVQSERRGTEPDRVLNGIDLTNVPDPVNPVVSDDVIYWCVGNECPMDFNASGTVNGADLSVLQNNFGGTFPCWQSNPGDANGDDLVNGADLSAYLSNFQRQCSQCNESEEELQARDGNPPEFLIVLGFETISEYVEYIEALTAEERSAYFAIVLALVYAMEED